MVALSFAFTPTAWAQNTPEVERLRKENELLKKENDLLKKEVDLLKKELELHKKEVPAKPGADDGDKAGAKARAKVKHEFDDTEYELLKCERDPRTKRVTFTLSAVNHVRETTSLGGKRSPNLQGMGLSSWIVVLTARGGEELKTKLVDQPQDAVKLRKSSTRTFKLVVEGVDEDIIVLDEVNLSYQTGGLTKTDPITFTNVEIKKLQSK